MGLVTLKKSLSFRDRISRTLVFGYKRYGRPSLTTARLLIIGLLSESCTVAEIFKSCQVLALIDSNYYLLT